MRRIARLTLCAAMTLTLGAWRDPPGPATKPAVDRLYVGRSIEVCSVVTWLHGVAPSGCFFVAPSPPQAQLI